MPEALSQDLVSICRTATIGRRPKPNEPERLLRVGLRLGWQSRGQFSDMLIVSRKWISTHLTANPDSVAARVLFQRGLDNENLLTNELRARLDDPTSALPDDDQMPLLLAISDNGTEMHANETRRFMALCSIAQHFGRPSTPTDQAWIESLWDHVEREHPHLMAITDPAVLAAELERVRAHYNSVRLHEAIGYVTPNDEHEGRVHAIRAARTDGMRTADQQRRAWHRSQR